MFITFMVFCRSQLCPFTLFLFDVLIKIFRTWCKKFISWTLFCHFTCLTTNHTDEITSNHRHSPMIFNSGTHQENMIGDIDTVLSWVICSDFAAHTCKHGSSGLPRPNVFCSGEMLPFLNRSLLTTDARSYIPIS